VLLLYDKKVLSKLDVRKNSFSAKDKRALKKAAGVGVFRSRYVQLKFLSFNSSLQQHICSFPVAHVGSSFYSSAPLTSPLRPCTLAASPTRSARVSAHGCIVYKIQDVSDGNSVVYYQMAAQGIC
jgi:hypothetical protein